MLQTGTVKGLKSKANPLRILNRGEHAVGRRELFSRSTNRHLKGDGLVRRLELKMQMSPNSLFVSKDPMIAQSRSGVRGRRIRNK